MNIVIQMLLCKLFILLSETENYIVWRFNSSLKVKTKLNHFKQVFTILEFDESIFYGSKLFETKRRLKLLAHSII